MFIKEVFTPLVVEMAWKMPYELDKRQRCH